VAVSLGGSHLFGNRLCVAVVSHSLEVLAFELGELDPVGGVADVEVQDGPDEREAARFAGKATDHLGAALDFAERAFEQVRAAPSPAVAGRVAQVHDEGVEVVGETFGGGGVASAVELVDERLQSLLSVALGGGVVEGVPIALTDALALSLRQLGEQVADAVNGAVLAV